MAPKRSCSIKGVVSTFEYLKKAIPILQLAHRAGGRSAGESDESTEQTYTLFSSSRLRSHGNSLANVPYNRSFEELYPNVFN